MRYNRRIISQKKNTEYWNLYKLLWGMIEFYRKRWIDHFRVFLSFNAILLPGITLILVYVIKENENELRLYIFIPCLIAITILVAGYNVLKRIAIDFDYRWGQLDRLEKLLKISPVCPSLEAKAYFKENNEGWKVKKAYYVSIWALILYYLLLIGFSVWPIFFH